MNWKRAGLITAGWLSAAFAAGLWIFDGDPLAASVMAAITYVVPFGGACCIMFWELAE